MKINTVFFGEINFNLAEGLFLTDKIELNNKSLNCNFYIQEGLFENKEALAKEAFRVIDKLEILHKAAQKQLISEQQSSNEIIQGFVDIHFDELQEEMEQNFSGISRNNFLEFIELVSVNLISGDVENEINVQLDFCIDKNLSDELLVVNFDRKGEVLVITHES